MSEYTETRKPVATLHYPGDVTPVDGTMPFGPNTLGEMLWPVTAEYDPETNTTTVGLSHLSPLDALDGRGEN